MITSRIAGKHQEHAKELGVDHYLGKAVFRKTNCWVLVRVIAPKPVEA